MSVPFQVTVALGASGLPDFFVKSMSGSVCSPVEPVRSRPGLPSWLRALAGMVLPVMSSSTAKPMSELPEILRMAASGPTWRSGKTHGALAVDADGVHLAAGGSDQHHRIEVRSLQREYAAFVLEQHGGVFAGPLDDLGVLFDGLGGYVMFRQPVHVAEVNDLVEHAAGGASDGGFVHGAVLEGFRHFLVVEFDAEVPLKSVAPGRLFGNVAAEHVGHGVANATAAGAEARASNRRKTGW